MGRWAVSATWDDVPHLSTQQKDELWSAFPEHERDARAKGVPMLGSGRVFAASEEQVACDAIAIPRHWPQLVGIDFGIDHPFAAVRIAWDRDGDIIYVTHCHRVRGQVPVMHAATVGAWGRWIPVVWPHDGLIRDKGSGEQLADLYRKAGLNMRGERVEHEEGGIGVEAGIVEMDERMLTGRLRVFRGLNDWWEEFRMYHRVDGLIVKVRDDLMAATRYAIMGKRHAIVEPRHTELRRPRLGTMA
jgi:hypothetical protein